MNRYILVFITVVLSLISCKQKENPREVDKEVIANEVNNMFTNYFRDIKTGGLMAEFEYLDQSPEFFWVPPGYNSSLNYDSVRAVLEKNAKAYTSIDYHWDTLQIFPLTEELANYTGIVKGIMIDTAGTSTFVSLIESGTVIKRPDGWKYLSGQTAALPPESQHLNE